MIQAIIFDCFGVLAGSAYTEIFRLAGGDLEKDGAFLHNLLATANAGFMSTQDMNQQIAKKLGITPDAWAEQVRLGELPNEQLLQYIEELRGRGLKTAILSNANTGTLERTFTPEQLALFDVLVVSADLHIIKPDPRIYEAAADKLDVNPQNCLFTDDNPHNVAGAKAVGMQAIIYKDLISFKESLQTYLD